MKNKLGVLIMATLILIGTVSGASEYCIPSESTDTVIESSGTWTNVTIYGACPICVQTSNKQEARIKALEKKVGI